MCDKTGIPGIFSNDSDRTAVTHPNILRLDSYISAATKPLYQNRKPWNVQAADLKSVRKYKRQSEEMLHDIFKASSKWTDWKSNIF